MRLDVIDFGRHELAPLPLLTHRAERLLRQHPPAQPLPPVGAIPLPTIRELANAPAHSRTLQLAAHEPRRSRARVWVSGTSPGCHRASPFGRLPAAIGSFPWLGQERDDLT